MKKQPSKLRNYVGGKNFIFKESYSETIRYVELKFSDY